MQRVGGAWDGRDINGKGKGQAAAMKYTDVDAKYDKMMNPEPVKAVPAKAATKTADKNKAAVAEEPKKKGFFGLF